MRLAAVGCALLLLVGCETVAMTSSARYPILLGPIDRIGGAPADASAHPHPSAAEFEGEDEAELDFCLIVAAPWFSMTHPIADGGLDASIERVYAAYAGKKPLSSLTARVDAIDVGAYTSYLAACYAHAWWAGAEGAVAP